MYHGQKDTKVPHSVSGGQGNHNVCVKKRTGITEELKGANSFSVSTSDMDGSVFHVAILQSTIIPFSDADTDCPGTSCLVLSSSLCRLADHCL